ncbi:MAG: hypothetical protein AAB373_05260 [Patescibacteria group bacterium]
MKNKKLYNFAGMESFKEARFVMQAKPPEAIKPADAEPLDPRRERGDIAREYVPPVERVDAPLRVTETLERNKLKPFLETVHKLVNPKITSTPDAMLENNPYFKKLYSSFLNMSTAYDQDAESIGIDGSKKKGKIVDRKFNIRSIERTNDGLNFVVKFDKPLNGEVDGETEFYLGRDSYKAIMWADIRIELKNIFKDKDIPDFDMAICEAAKNPDEYENFEKLVNHYIATPRATLADPDWVDKAYKELVSEDIAKEVALTKRAKEVAEHPERASTIERDAVAVQVEATKERSDLKKEVITPPRTEYMMEAKAFLDKSNTDVLNDLNDWSLNSTRETQKVNAQNWVVTTPDGVDKTYTEWKNLGLISKTNAAFFDTTFTIFKETASHKFPDQETQDLFKLPGENKDKIRALPAVAAVAATDTTPGNSAFPGGELYIKAYENFLAVRKVMTDQDTDQINTAGAQEAIGEDWITEKGVKFMRDNYAAATEAVRTGDWPTVASYVLGGIAIWKSYKILFGADPHAAGDHAASTGWGLKEFAILGSAAYFGNVILKNAGIDVAKKFGLTNLDAELKGTPLAYMNDALSKDPLMANKVKDIDWGIALKISETRLSTLDALKNKANNGGGIDFIDPREFGAIFGNFDGVAPYKGLTGAPGSNDNKDFVGNIEVNLGPNQQEYERVGKQLFLIAQAMNSIYDHTLHLKHSAYKDLTYQEALSDDILRNSKLRHLMNAVKKYIAGNADLGFNTSNKNDVQSKLDKVLEGQKIPIYLEEPFAEKSGHYPGTVNGFPVVVIDEPGEYYKIYLRNAYGPAYTQVPTGIASAAIKKEGTKEEAEQEMKNLTEAITDRMKALTEPITRDGGKARDIGYRDNVWKGKFTMPAAEKFGKTGTNESEYIITPRKFGDGVTLSIAGTKIEINIDEHMTKENLLGLVILPDMMAQKEFAGLKPFSDAQKLKVEDGINPNNNIATLVIGDGKFKLNIKFENGKFLVNDPAKEEALIKNELFKNELMDILDKDDELNDTMASWKKVLDETDEKFFTNFFTQVPTWFTGMTWHQPLRGVRLESISGSIPENYTRALIASQKSLMISKVGFSLGNVTTLEGVGDSVDVNFKNGIKALKKQRDEFAQEAVQKDKDGDAFGKGEFMSDVFDKVATAGIKSESYKAWYKAFVNEVFLTSGFDDFRDKNADNARKLVEVFTHYTAVVDDPEMDVANPAFVLTSDMRDAVLELERVEKNLGRPLTAADAEFTAVAARFRTLPADKLFENHLEHNKWKLYHLHGDYINYVYGQINIKIGEGALKNGNIPPIGAWDIDEFRNWKNDDTRVSSNHSIDLVRTNELPAKKLGDYMEFDEFLSIRRRDPTEADRILATPDLRAKIVLPRKDVPLRIMSGTDGRLFNELLGVNDLLDVYSKTPEERFNLMKKTELEVLFHEKFKDAVTKIREKYKTNPAFDEIEKRYNLGYYFTSPVNIVNARNVTVGILIDYKYSFDPIVANQLGITPGVQPVAESSMALSMTRLESILSHSANTREEQVRVIQKEIESIFDREILDEAHFDKYFNEPGAVKNMVTWVRDLWRYIW